MTDSLWKTNQIITIITAMRSYQILQNCTPEEQPFYSDLQVLKSADGWYLGTLYNSVYGTTPGSRDSDYYLTEEKAKYALHYLENLHTYLHKTHSAEDIATAWERQMHTFDCDPRQVGYRFYP